MENILGLSKLRYLAAALSIQSQSACPSRFVKRGRELTFITKHTFVFEEARFEFIASEYTRRVVSRISHLSLRQTGNPDILRPVDPASSTELLTAICLHK